MLATEGRRTYRDWQPKRAYEGLRQALVGWFNLEDGGRLSPPEESLGVQRVKQEDASFENPSNLKMDTETALLRCGASFQEKMVTFQFLSTGGNYRARDNIGKRFGLAPARVAGMADKTLCRMVEYLTGHRP